MSQRRRPPPRYYGAMRVSRRGFLGGTSALLTGCAVRRGPVATIPSGALSEPRLAQVHVSSDRVIRSITGLRPFRPSGFVVRGEKRGDKTVIHNYGHGRAGITLSWGTAQLAVEEGAKSEARDCAVLRRRGSRDRAVAATARLQPNDLRERDAAADDVEWGRRTLGSCDAILQGA
jgi:glycine/D-amino acid oxidase-like deaminating enzyme